MKTISTKSLITLIALLISTYAIAQTGNYFAGFASGTGNTGSYNAFVGYQSGVSYNSGWYNTFLGYQSGLLNSSGSYNTFIGSFAGYDNQSGLSNTFVGWAAGSNNTTASSNSFFGNLAGYQTATGGSNSFFGSAAGYANNTGANNVFVGNRAGYNNNGSDNVMIGQRAGEGNTSGYWNTFSGSSSGLANTTGYHNTFEGARSGPANTTGYRNAFFGTESGMLNTSGRENTFIGRGAGRNNTTGHFNTALGNYAQPSGSNLSYTTAIGHKAFVKVSNAVVIGSVSGENSATVTTKVGIGTCAPAYLLHVNGVAAKPGGGSWTVASDRKLKKDIQPFQEGLQEILQVNPVWFRYNGKAGMPTEKRYVGVIAQEMQKVAPHTVSEFVYEDGEGNNERYLDYDANALNYMLVNAVKELNTVVNEQQLIIGQLKEEIAALKKGAPLPETADGPAKLWQNAPNPYAHSTIIRYYVPETAGSAQLIVYSVNGQEVYRQELTQRGAGQIEVSNQVIASGGYIYHLVMDGKIIDGKKMIVTK